MIVGQMLKQPGEIFPITEDFAAELATGETIQSVTVSAKNMATLVDSSASVLQGTYAISGSKVSHQVKAGAHGEVHRVKIAITTSSAPGNAYEHEVDILVVAES